MHKKLLIDSNSASKKNVKEQLQPALLDRLTDDNPEIKKSKRDTIIYFDDLKLAVLRDLQWLLNTSSILSEEDEISGLDYVLKSTVNYGINPLAGKTMSEINYTSLINKLKSSIINFEPRILADSLNIEVYQSSADLESHNIIAMSISGKLWCNPFPRDFVFSTNIDLESGHVELSD